ncbi:MAG TPA: hypothetical protein VLL49_04365 [Anaerolineales bacterium]|nr:hypothetical protein [Anaerolineales bacterium]
MDARAGTWNEVERLDAIERRLAGALRPVVPPQALLERLRSRIRMPDRTTLLRRLHDWRTLMLVLGGVLSGGLLLITLARAMFHIFGRRQGG